MNADIKDMVKNCLTGLDFKATQPKDKTMFHEILGRLWEYVGADIITINNKHYLCILDYHSRFLVIKNVEGFSVDNIIKIYKIIFSENGLTS